MNEAGHPQPRPDGSLPSPESGVPRRTVLVVDDEAHVREIVRRMLALQQLNVLVAGSVVEAVDLLERSCGAVDVVLSDITMPEQDGWDLFRVVRDRWPDTAVLFMSGHHHSLSEPVPASEARPVVIEKPFTIEALATAVRLALGT